MVEQNKTIDDVTLGSGWSTAMLLTVHNLNDYLEKTISRFIRTHPQNVAVFAPTGKLYGKTHNEHFSAKAWVKKNL